MALAEVFARALSPRPDDRYPAALAFAAALKHALTGEPLGAGHEPERPKSRRAGRSAQKAQAAQEPPAAVPADLLLAAPRESEPRYDPASALIRQDARLSEAVTEPLAELPSAPPPGATPLPSFLESYALAETQPAPLETTALDLPAPEPAADMPAALGSIVVDAPAAEPAAPSPGEVPDDTLAEAEIQTAVDVPPPAPDAAPLRLEALDIGLDADTLDGVRDTAAGDGAAVRGHRRAAGSRPGARPRGRAARTGAAAATGAVGLGAAPQPGPGDGDADRGLRSRVLRWAT